MDRWTATGLALVLGGAAGNLFDRILWGRVTDFLEFYIRDMHWPTFNVADSCIVIGSGLLLVDLLRPKRQPAGA
jgi:signal peptidase II